MSVSVKTEYLAPAEPSMPGMAVEVIELVDSYMIWVGVAESPETVQTASLVGRLCNDWAYAMPPREGEDMGAGTWLFRSENSDAGLSMARRLAKRLRKAITVSIDVGVAEERMMAAERGIVGLLERK